MDLKTFLSVNGVSVRAFARKCGTSASSIVRIRDQTVIPSRRIMEAIHAASDGLVCPADLVPKHFSSPDAQGQGRTGS